MCSASSSVSFELQQKKAYADTREEWEERDLSRMEVELRPSWILQ